MRLFRVICLIGVCLIFCPVDLLAAISTSERAALIDLYNSTNGAGWNSDTGWKTAPLDTDGFSMPGTEGTWYGITVTSDTVIEIFLDGNGLSGSIPDSIGNLVNLKELDLGGNQLTGSIPDSIGNLTQMDDFDLDVNQLTGSIPETIGNMQALTCFDVDSNQLTGEIPDSIGDLSNLECLEIYNNQIGGSIPASIGDLTNLEELFLSGNQFSGSIPDSIGNLVNLYELDFSFNQLTGNIPESMGNLSNLEVVQLHNNQLTGKIPSTLSGLSMLQEFQVNTNQFTGSIPEELCSLSSLRILYLGGNQLTGTIPDTIRNLTALEQLDLMVNQLSGPIPESFMDLENLQGVTLCSNFLYTENDALRDFITMRHFNVVDGQISPYSDWESCQIIGGYNLIVSVIGSGTVTSDPAGISCGSDCGFTFTDGQEVTLTATPADGFTFAGWTGTTTSSESIITVTIDGMASLTAQFVAAVDTFTPTLLTPVDTINTASPSYEWKISTGATWYRFWLTGPSGNIFDKWYTAEEVVSGDKCQLSSVADLLNGTHTWWVRAWSESAGYSEWSDGMVFDVETDAPTAVQLVSPSGTVSSGSITFTWKTESASEWYYVWINDAGGNNVLKKWYKAETCQNDCSSGNTSLTKDLELSPGSYTWWIQTWNGDGYGPWSSGMVFTLN